MLLKAAYYNFWCVCIASIHKKLSLKEFVIKEGSKKILKRNDKIGSTDSYSELAQNFRAYLKHFRAVATESCTMSPSQIFADFNHR